MPLAKMESFRTYRLLIYDDLPTAIRDFADLVAEQGGDEFHRVEFYRYDDGWQLEVTFKTTNEVTK